MAARLVKRCTCLLRQATRLAPAGPPVGQLRLAGVAQKTLTSSATSPSSLSQHVEKGQVFTPSPERQEVDELIEKATQPEELLGLLEGGHSLSQGHAALVLIQLSRLLSERPADKASLTQDVRFQQLLHLVNSQVGSRPVSRGDGRGTGARAAIRRPQRSAGFLAVDPPSGCSVRAAVLILQPAGGTRKPARPAWFFPFSRGSPPRAMQSGSGWRRHTLS